MLRSLSIAPIPLALILLAACGDDGAECVCPAEDSRIIGHRGSGTTGESNPWPENTLPSLEAAMVDGADGVEFDVLLSADGELVLMHDVTVDRTTDGTGCVNELTLDELRMLDAGVPAMAGEGVQVPTLAEVIATIDEGILDVELKVDATGSTCEPTDREATVAALLADLEGFPRDRLIVTSFDAEILSLIRADDASVPVALLGSTLDDVDIAEGAGFDGVALFYLTVTRSVVDDARARGLGIWAWTVNDEPTMEELMSLGVDGVITDEVSSAGAVRDRLCADYAC